MSSAVRHIIGSFEDIGKDVVRETVKVPADVAGKALESLGTSSGKTQQGPLGGSVFVGSSDRARPKDAWDTIEKQASEKEKHMIARAALEALSGRPKQKEPTVWDKLQKENEDKDAKQKTAAAAASYAQLPTLSAKRARGDLYGLQAKRNPAEIGKNVKTD